MEFLQLNAHYMKRDDSKPVWKNETSVKEKKKKQQDPPLYTPFKLGHEAWKLWHVNEISLLSS